jgi:hypothetical protein
MSRWAYLKKREFSNMEEKKKEKQSLWDSRSAANKLTKEQIALVKKWNRMQADENRQLQDKAYRMMGGR